MTQKVGIPDKIAKTQEANPIEMARREIDDLSLSIDPLSVGEATSIN